MKPLRFASILLATCFALATGALALQSCSPGARAPATDQAHEGHDDHHGDEPARGPHGGRMFAHDDVRLELLIAEDGIPPEFRAYLYGADGTPVPAVDGALQVTLHRFGGRVDSIPFDVEGDRFRGTRTVVEPHSFEAEIVLERDGHRHTWTWTQHEGRVELALQAVARGDIGVGSAGARDIAVVVETPGEVRLNAERVVQVRPRFPGLIERLPARLGDTVHQGDVLAVVHSNESLTSYEIVAPSRGTIVSRDVSQGQSVNHETVLFTVADLATVWVDFALYPQISGRVRTGQVARIRSSSNASLTTEGRVGYVGPLLEQDTRVSYGRVVLPNQGGRWQPGLYVTVAVVVESFRARVAVPEDAIVRTASGSAVFRAEGTTFEMQPVEVGRSDGTWTEIVGGVAPGDSVVVRNAFLLKAELGKSEASHDH